MKIVATCGVCGRCIHVRDVHRLVERLGIWSPFDRDEMTDCRDCAKWRLRECHAIKFSPILFG